MHIYLVDWVKTNGRECTSQVRADSLSEAEETVLSWGDCDYVQSVTCLR